MDSADDWPGVYLLFLSLLYRAVIHPCIPSLQQCHLLCFLIFFSSKDQPAARQDACISLAGYSLNFTVISNGTQNNRLASGTDPTHDR
jgi:hypothetical protein